MCMCHGSGAISCWFCLLLRCVVAETYWYRSISASAPTFANPGNSFGTAGSRVVESSERDCATLDDSDDDDWPDGGYSCSREGRQVEQQRESMAQVELRDESVRCSRRPALSGAQNGTCGEQRAAWRCAVVCRLDHVAHGKRLESHRKCFTRLEYGSVAISLSDVFSEERRKVGCADE